MEHTPIELKLITLALDPAARDGEVTNAAAMLFRSLRKRGVTPQLFDDNQQIATLKQTIKDLTLTLNRQAQLIRSLNEERIRRTTPPPLPITPPPLPENYVTSVDRLFKRDRWHEVDREENLRRWSKEAREDTWFEKLFGR